MTGTPADRLGLWEAVSGAGPLDRDLALLRAAHPDAEPAALRRIGVGRRDEALLRWYLAVYGDRLDGAFDCTSCGETVEISLAVTDLITTGAGATPDDDALTVEVDGYRLRVRPPDTDDLAAARIGGRHTLAARIVTAAGNGQPVAVTDLPAEALDAALRALAEHDPLVDPTLAATCPWCQAPCDTLLDAGAFLTARLRIDALRLLSDVDTLARAYGWSEPDILALSDRRREAYLEFVR
ncbi:hypothetical protein [Micromonospora endophytica]|uniref:Uncharacterized protein n=1 Tax=Micromonospora endophytica TaxID=515350 RepID=A0A2W2DLH4_9ACTN|nr:hypothetical protein [Micromonospora endophytica]PZF98026.1 hypothetical protein C1I93_10040 [Micromonospora endophytica]BCJ57219.1 hypothetical protein Jiend_06410 [Micromonospora endophytica]